MQRVFSKAFKAKFPIRKMRLVDVYKGNDVTSMAADNTSAFNCRKVTGNPYRLSQHSYGHAIDINTVENPYVTSSRVYPCRSPHLPQPPYVRKGMILSGGVIARACQRRAGRGVARSSNPDYQHFSADGIIPVVQAHTSRGLGGGCCRADDRPRARRVRAGRLRQPGPAGALGDQ